MRYVWLVLLMIFAGCDTPSPHFGAAPVSRIAVNGSTFDVRLRGNLAEAVRVTPEYAPRFGPIRYRAGLAMALVSGCSVTTVLGDQAQALGRLDCPDRRSPMVRVDRACTRVTGRGASYPGYRCLPS